MSYIYTYSGEQFDLLNPDPDAVHLVDIAHALSNICRFTGHTKHFYSVAEHSITASYIAESTSEDLARILLLHDAAEAYIGDLSRVLKTLLGEKVQAIEDSIVKAIQDKFQVYWDHDDYKNIDNVMLLTEARNLVREIHGWEEKPLELALHCWTPRQAENAFINRAESLEIRDYAPKRADLAECRW